MGLHQTLCLFCIKFYSFRSQLLQFILFFSKDFHFGNKLLRFILKCKFYVGKLNLGLIRTSLQYICQIFFYVHNATFSKICSSGLPVCIIIVNCMSKLLAQSIIFYLLLTIHTLNQKIFFTYRTNHIEQANYRTTIAFFHLLTVFSSFTVIFKIGI